MKDIFIKQVNNQNGDFSHLELHQGTNVIEISLATSAIDTQPHTYKWDVLKRLIEKQQGAAMGEGNFIDAKNKIEQAVKSEAEKYAYDVAQIKKANKLLRLEKK